MIKNILFDMGGVIFCQNSEEAFRRFRQAGIDTDKYMGAFGQKEFFLDLETGAIDTETFCRKMAEAAGRKEVGAEEASLCWLGFIREVPENRLECLDRLRKDYHVCLLSNTNPFVMGFTRSERFSRQGRPITDYFDSLFCSYEMKVCKPDAEIFRRALAADDMRAEECLFVDDSTTNTDAAEKLGFNVMHVKTDEDWTQRIMTVLHELNSKDNENH